ncbi:MAG: alpha/beta fold hydrolase [Alphaproteobacteria bacterium]|nr:MAG: alpha/beta fold hydrolase [Alphaproteobacteria bacterium]
MKKFWEEIKRRKVFQFAAIYAVAAWVIVQISVAVFPALLLPDWAVRLVVIIAVLGFPLVLILAWAHETSPVGTAAKAGTSEVQPLPDCPSLAVLPFSNISSDPEQEHLADSLTEDLITDLSKHAKLDVIARNSTFTYKGRAVDVRQVGQDLGVHLVLEGSLRKARDMVRFTAQLIDARTGHHLWADRQDINIADELAAQDSICRSITDNIVSVLFKESGQLGAPAPKDSTPAMPFLINTSPYKTKYTQVDGLNIAYNERGAGPHNFVFVPGMISHLELMDNMPTVASIPSLLSSLGHVVTFDKRGQGMSDPIKGAPDLDERMNDVRAVMDAVGLDKAILVGSSEGAPMSLLFAATYPERVQGLILIGGCARWAAADDYSIGISTEDIGRSLSQWGTGALRNVFNPEVPEEAISTDAMAALERLIATPASLEAQIKLIQTVDVRHILPMVQVPTLVMHMRKDNAVPRRLAKYMADHIPGAEYYEMPGMGHMSFPGKPEHLEKIRQFCAAVEDHARETESILATVLAVRGHADEIKQIAQKFAPNNICETEDGATVLTFDGPSRAVRCAQALAKEHPSEDLCPSLHTGLVEINGSQAKGQAVLQALDNMAFATRGQPLMTPELYELVKLSSLQISPFEGGPSDRSFFVVKP